MRSRYSAYALGLWAYLYQTGPQVSSLKEEQAAISQWCADKQWLSLQVLNTIDGEESQETGEVEFVAFYRSTSALLNQHHEYSYFKKIDNQWRFISGDSLPNLDIGRNQACPCGSGKKYKRCCLD